MFRFSPANTKLEKLYRYADSSLKEWLGDSRKKVYSIDLLSGYSCPMAHLCLSRAKKLPNGKRQIQDGPETQHRCYSASQEAQYPAVYNKRAENLKVLSRAKTEEEIHAILAGSLPLDAGVIRGGGSGDFFSIEYFRAFLRLARENPGVLFYAYTKCLSYWVDNREEVESLPNLVMTASRGGLEDDLIDKHALREALVVLSADESEYVGELDETDIHAADPARRDESFRLLIHGSQPAGSEASKALQILKTA